MKSAQKIRRKYEELLGLSQEEKFQGFMKKLQENLVFIKITPNIDDRIRISIERTDSESTVYNVSLGFFRTQITALNINGPHDLFE